ncbi:hypothetical protein SBRY_30355 [Actinacidiphila bryophytorum]|uniref:Uncharacterized protein n=1 Tax=Actinacidiphila bryophytorum TaxID=1436133 RepID=A0A9W4H0V1_9ACTN|nr:hypothetical protein SBRY_30355 [Actinacidiphila bryophytorum]
MGDVGAAAAGAPAARGGLPAGRALAGGAQRDQWHVGVGLRERRDPDDPGLDVDQPAGHRGPRCGHRAEQRAGHRSVTTGA